MKISGVTCPKCGHDSFDRVEGLLRCQNRECSHYFAAPAHTDLPVTEGETSEERLAQYAVNPAHQEERIARSASGLMVIAALFAGAGFLVGLISLLAVVAAEDAGNGFWIAAALIGVAFWICLLAQIVHIRALLAKK